MISKELLSEVLGSDISLYKKKANDKYDAFIRYFFSIDEYEINIHELAHKCKEWAFDLGYDVETSPSGYVRISKNEYIILSDSMFGKEKKEAENSIKACQWILENKDKK